MRQTPAPRKVQNSIWLSVGMLLFLLSPSICFVGRTAVKVTLGSFIYSSFFLLFFNGGNCPFFLEVKLYLQLSIVFISPLSIHSAFFRRVISCFFMCLTGVRWYLPVRNTSFYVVFGLIMHKPSTALYEVSDFGHQGESSDFTLGCRCIKKKKKNRLMWFLVQPVLVSTARHHSLRGCQLLFGTAV